MTFISILPKQVSNCSSKYYFYTPKETSFQTSKGVVALFFQMDIVREWLKTQKPKWLKRLLRRVRGRFFLRKNPYPKGLCTPLLGK
jgi:hypothetical protein